jgi:hypothetical protein
VTAPVRVSVELPFKKETPGALLYGLPGNRDRIVSSVYVRKDHLSAAGHTGPWPRSITITVEVPST